MTEAFSILFGLAAGMAARRLRYFAKMPGITAAGRRLTVGTGLAFTLAGAAAWAGWSLTRSPGVAVALALTCGFARAIWRDHRASREALGRDREVQSLVALTADTLDVYPAVTHALYDVALGAPLWLRRGLMAALGNHAAGMPLRVALEGWAAASRRRDLMLYARLLAEAHDTSSAAVDALRRLGAALRRRCDHLASRRAELAGQRLLLAAALLGPPAAYVLLLLSFPWVREWYTSTTAGHAVSSAGAAGWVATLFLAWRVAWRDEA